MAQEQGSTLETLYAGMAESAQIIDHMKNELDLYDGSIKEFARARREFGLSAPTAFAALVAALPAPPAED